MVLNPSYEVANGGKRGQPKTHMCGWANVPSVKNRFTSPLINTTHSNHSERRGPPKNETGATQSSDPDTRAGIRKAVRHARMAHKATKWPIKKILTGPVMRLDRTKLVK